MNFIMFHQTVSENIYPQTFKVTPISRNCKRINAISREQKKLRELIVKLGSLFLHKTPRPEKNHREFYALALLFPMPIFRLWPTSYIQTAITWQSVNWHSCADNFRYAHYIVSGWYAKSIVSRILYWMITLQRCH